MSINIFYQIKIIIIFQDEPQILGTTDGTIGNRKLFQCHQNHGKFVPISEIVKEEEFFSILTGDVTHCDASSRGDILGLT